MAKDKRWIQKAVKHPGSFTKYCGGKVTEECIQRGLKSKDPTIRRRAALARTFRKMAKNRKKAAFGLEDIIDNPILQDTNIDEMGLLGLSTLLGALSTGTLVGSLSNINNQNEQYLRSMFDNIYGVYAQGGDVSNVPIEVEGGEVIETPNGVVKVNGPSHNQGGVPINVPTGSTVYSKRIVVNGKTMAQRKLEREKKEKKYRKLYKETKDPVIKSTLDRILQINTQQEIADRQFQNIVRQINAIVGATGNKYATGGDVTGIDMDKLIQSLIGIESNGKATAVSKKGARGYAQFMPSTWDEIWSSNNPEIQKYIEEHGKPDIHTEDITAHKIAAKIYIDNLKQRYKSKGLDDSTALFVALTAYNYGPTKLDREVKEKYNGDYVKAIVDWKNNAIPFMSYSRKIFNQAGYDDNYIFGNVVKGVKYTGDVTPKGNPILEYVTTKEEKTPENINDIIAKDEEEAMREEEQSVQKEGDILSNNIRSQFVSKEEPSNNMADNTDTKEYQDYLDKLLSSDSYTTKEGTTIGAAGTLVSATGPLWATLQAEKNNRPFENYYKDYGQQLIQNALSMYNMARANTNMAQNEIARQQYLATANANQNIANSSVRAAATNAAMSNANRATTKTEQSYINAITNINNSVSQILSNIERTRLAGAQQADMWNRKQQDNTWTQLVRNITNLGLGLQQYGKNLNLQGYNDMVREALKSLKITP